MKYAQKSDRVAAERAADAKSELAAAAGVDARRRLTSITLIALS